MKRKKIKEEIVITQLPILVGLFKLENGITDDEIKAFSNDDLFSNMFVWALATNRIKGIELPQEVEPTTAPTGSYGTDNSGVR